MARAARPGLRRLDAELWVAEASTLEGSGLWKSFAGDASSRAGLVIVGALVLVAILAPALAPRDPLSIDPAHVLQGPSVAYPFGTDNLGRDIFSRVIAGTRISVPLALITGVATVAIGVVAGALAGYVGGWVDSLVMRIVDVFLAFPPLVLALAIAGTLGAGYWGLFLALVSTWWPTYARLVRAGVLAERERAYIDAARSLGARPRRVVLVHILPNVLPPVLVLLSFDLGFIILAVASLGYLGVGVAPPTPEWGTMVSAGKDYVFSAPQMIIFPGLAVAVAVVGFNLVGEGLRNALDPRRALAGGGGRPVRGQPAPPPDP